MDGRRMRTQSTRYLKTARTKSVTFAEEVQKEEFEVPSTDSSSSSLSSLDDDKERQKEIKEMEEEAKKKAKESEDGRARADTEGASEGTGDKPLVRKGVSFRGELKGDGDGKKKMSRFDSFANRTTSIFHIRRQVNKPEETQDPEQREFVYANIIRVEDDEEEMQEKVGENTVGSGVSYTSEATYIEQEYGDKLLNHYKTNDTWYFGRSDKPKTSKINRRVVFCGLFILLGLLGIITAVILVIPQPDTTGNIKYDHDKVYILVGSRLEQKMGTAGKCQYERKCPDICVRTIERQEGCCIGCPVRQEDPLDDNCNFNVTVGFKNITELEIRQRIYMFASLDGKNFFQTGYAPPVVKKDDIWTVVVKEETDPLDPSTPIKTKYNETLSFANETIVPNACFSTANQPILLVACLSPYNLFDFACEGIPAHYCTSFRGICYNTNNALLAPMEGCVETGLGYYEWEGNRWENEREWRENFGSITPVHNVKDIAEKDRPQVEMETESSDSARVGVAATWVSLVAAAVVVAMH